MGLVLSLMSRNEFIGLVGLVASLALFLGGIAESSIKLWISGLALSVLFGSYYIQQAAWSITKFFRRKKYFSGKITVIGIGGERGSGKSAAADFFENRYGSYNTFFAKALKESAKAGFDLTDYDVYDEEGKESLFHAPLKIQSDALLRFVDCAKSYYPGKITQKQVEDIFYVALGREFPRPRELLQFLGTEVLRECVSPDFHAMCVYHEIYQKVLGGCRLFAISDMRFKNERDFVSKELGGYKLLIDIPDELRKKDSASQHKSETSLGSKHEYDYVYLNKKDGFDPYHKYLTKVLEEIRYANA